MISKLKKERRNKIMRKRTRLGIAVIGFLWTIFVTFWWPTTSNQELKKNYIDKSIVANNINGNIEQKNIIINSGDLSDIEDKKNWDNNKAKIRTFFVYRNDKEFMNAINTISLKIQYIFTEEKLIYFREHLTEWFEIKSYEERWEISNGELEITTKHNIVITYWYDNKIYTNNLFVVVRRDNINRTQHHITQMRCENSEWPLCNFLKK